MKINDRPQGNTIDDEILCGRTLTKLDEAFPHFQTDIPHFASATLSLRLSEAARRATKNDMSHDKYVRCAVGSRRIRF